MIDLSILGVVRHLQRAGRVMVLLGALVSAAALGISGAHPVGSTPEISAWLQAWPMNGHDPARSNRSPVQGPLHPRLVRKQAGFFAELIAPNGTIVGTQEPHAVLADVTPGGTLKTLSSSVTGASAIRPDGVILAASDAGTKAGSQGRADAVSAAGRFLWERKRIGLARNATPLVAPDGRFFIAAEEHPQLKSAGLWILSTGGTIVAHLARGNPTFGVARDGIGDTDMLVYDLRAAASFLRVYSPSLKELWQYRLSAPLGEPGACACLLAGRSGRVYVGEPATIVTLDTRGRVVWEVKKRDGVLNLAERADGVLLVAGNRTLTAISSSGQSLWSADIHLHHKILPTDLVQAVTLAVDRAGTAYVGTADGKVVVIDAGGHITARIPAGGYRHGGTPGVMIGPTGSLVVAGTDSVLRIYR